MTTLLVVLTIISKVYDDIGILLKIAEVYSIRIILSIGSAHYYVQGCNRFIIFIHRYYIINIYAKTF